MIRATVVLLLAATLAVGVHAEEQRLTFTQGDRLEYQQRDDVTLWDLQGWYGGDYHKLWWKLEGEAEAGERETELQLLYSRAYTAYFDLQFGVRYDDHETGEDVALAFGIQGLAPYRFEIDAAAFLTENGDVLLRGEFERDILLTQRLILQPRAELSAALQDIPERAIDSGLTSTSLDLRLRYELRRKFAPYVGISWRKNFGATADAIEAAGDDPTVTSLVAGIRFWF